MMIYLILLITLFVCGVELNNSTLTIKGFSKRHMYRTDVLLSIMILIIFAALRNTRLGVDLWNYENSFHWRSELSPVQVIDSIGSERIYHLFSWLISQFTQNFSIFLLIVACISIIPVGICIGKYSDVRWLSIWLYVCMGFYTFGFSALRQTIAFGLSVGVFCLVEEHNYKKAIILLALAVGFHNSAIICLPFFFLNRIPKKKNILILIVAAGIAVALFGNKVLSIGLSLFGRQDYGSMETGGKIWFVALVIMVAVGIIWKNQIWEDEIGWHLFLIISAAVIIMPICFSNPVLFRANYYYMFYICIYIPRMLRTINMESKKTMIMVMVFLTALYFFHNALPSGHLETYKFFWQ